jgi:hypothetical protein
MNIAGFAFGSMVDRLESLPEAPDTPNRRRRAAWIVLGLGLDPGQYGISLDEFTPEEVAFMPSLRPPSSQADND